ncbi:ras-related protein Rab-38 [Anolis sagrei]|uniref:ras-related protein Rab-38 n=1 Tax=Anolis sagrei TaxID=38937 RepID=UPI00352021F1
MPKKPPSPPPPPPSPSPRPLSPAPLPPSPPRGPQERLYKLLVIGDLGVGKTSIIKRYVHQNFSPHYRATIGVDFALKVLPWDARTVVRLQLWDIAGQERFGNMTRVYYRDAMGAFIVFDVTRPATFEAVTKWKEDLDTKLTLPNGKPVPTVLLANKCDQTKEVLVNNGIKMEQFCQENGFVGWFETSAKENINIDEASRCLVKHIMATESDPVEQPVEPDVVKPHLNSSKFASCSACFRS